MGYLGTEVMAQFLETINKWDEPRYIYIYIYYNIDGINHESETNQRLVNHFRRPSDDR